MPTSTAMQIESRELNACTVELTVSCSSEQVRAGFEKAYRRAAKRVKVPGFRPGTAPKNILKNFVNQDAVNEFAAEEIISDAYKAAVKEQNLEPQGGPRIELLKLEEEASECEFKAKVPLEPRVELADYNALEAQQPSAAVTDEEVEEQIQKMREKRATRKNVQNRGAEIGDFAVIGIKPTDKEGEGSRFMTVIGQTFPQLDQLLSGMKAEETKVDDLTFPEQFQEKEWAGNTLKCQVTVRSLSAPELPELTQDFAKQFNTESVEELNARVREEMGKAKQAWVQNYVNEQLLDALLKQSDIQIPDNLWENVSEQRLRELAKDAAKDGLTLQQVAERANMSLDQLKDQVRHESETSVKRALAMQEVFKKEGLTLSKEDMARQVEVIAHENGMSPGDALRALKQSGKLGEVEWSAMYEKVTALLRDKAKLIPA